MMTALKEHERYMTLALEEAARGRGRTSPNPCVGAVLVRDHTILATGYHKKAGSAHAEIEAIRNANCDLEGATLYVTLEPCSHKGRTGPCCEAVVAAGISLVVVGMTDPNPLVSGRGLRYLADHGVEVVQDVLANKCRELNAPFVKHITTGTPWVVMKAGMSLDGRLTYQQGAGGAITGEASKKQLHRLRNIYDAILVGINTVIIDDPSLTTRLEEKKCRDPLRVILDTELRLPLKARIINQISDGRTLVACSKNAAEDKKAALTEAGVELLEIPTAAIGLDLSELLLALGQKGVCSLLVEGGRAVHGAFLRDRLYDYAHLFVAPVFIGDGGLSLLPDLQIKGKSETVRLVSPQITTLDNDLLISGTLSYPS